VSDKHLIAARHATILRGEGSHGSEIYGLGLCHQSRCPHVIDHLPTQRCFVVVGASLAGFIDRGYPFWSRGRAAGLSAHRKETSMK
jgi:hypothetical protein